MNKLFFSVLGIILAFIFLFEEESIEYLNLLRS